MRNFCEYLNLFYEPWDYVGDYPKRDTHLQCDLEAIYDVFAVLKTTDMDQGAENERNVQQANVLVLPFVPQAMT